MIANGHRASFGGDENVLKLTGVRVAHIREYSKNQQRILYTVNGSILWYVNYISIKVLTCVCGVCSLKRPSQTDTEPQTCLGSEGLMATRLPCVLCDRSASWLSARGEGRGRNVPPRTDYIIRRALCKMEKCLLFFKRSIKGIPWWSSG